MLDGLLPPLLALSEGSGFLPGFKKADGGGCYISNKQRLGKSTCLWDACVPEGRDMHVR